MKSVLALVFLLSITSKCFGQLSAQDASEGPCLSAAKLQPFLYNKTNIVPLLPPGKFYAPMGSKALYRHYAQGLLGRPAKDQAELDSMKLVFSLGIGIVEVVSTGFPYLNNPPNFTQICELDLGLGASSLSDAFEGEIDATSVQAVCTGLSANRPDGTVVLKPPSTSSVDSVIWVKSDSKVIIIYRCPDDNIQDFKVISRSKTLSDDDIAFTKQTIVELGFSLDHIEFMKYD